MLPFDEMPTEIKVVHFQISPVNNNISKSNFSSGSGAVTPPPAPVVSLPGSMTQGMGGAAFAGGVAQAPVTSFAATPSFPRQQFPSSGMYGWY